jgi:hypothetical protein
MVPSLAGMAVWDELRLTLDRLLEEQSGALKGYPDPSRSEGGPPPYAIRLAPWAEAVAASGPEDRIPRRTPVLPLIITA